MEPDSIPNQGMFHSIQEAASRLAVEPAAALALSIPASLLARADEVIE
jgi:hypothetical protein